MDALEVRGTELARMSPGGELRYGRRVMPRTVPYYTPTVLLAECCIFWHCICHLMIPPVCHQSARRLCSRVCGVRRAGLNAQILKRTSSEEDPAAHAIVPAASCFVDQGAGERAPESTWAVR